MISRKPLLVIIAVGLLLLAATPRQVSADITGNTYSFGAIFFEQSYRVDNTIVLDETIQGDFQVTIFNITPSDSYEYTFTGLNYYAYMFSPFYDERNGSVAFQDNKVHFDLDTVDVDADNLTENYDFDIYPYFSGSSPGGMFFVNPVWSTHNTDWNAGVDDAEAQHSVTAVTESADEGRFSCEIIFGNEYNHSVYNYMNGTVTISFSATYDTDGVLSTWSIQRVTSSSNENHTVVHTQKQSFTQGAVVGAVGDSTLATTLALIGVAGIAGLIVGVVIGKKY